MRGRRAVRVVLCDEEDARATLHAWWFFTAHGVLAVAKEGTRCIVQGRIRRDPPRPARVAHPDLVADEVAARVVRARYPRLGVGEAVVRRAIAGALASLPELPDPVPTRIAVREEMAELAPLLRAVHGASGVLGSPPTLDVRRALVERMAWTEAFARVWERVQIEARHGKGSAARRRTPRSAPRSTAPSPPSPFRRPWSTRRRLRARAS